MMIRDFKHCGCDQKRKQFFGDILQWIIMSYNSYNILIFVCPFMRNIDSYEFDSLVMDVTILKNGAYLTIENCALKIKYAWDHKMLTISIVTTFGKNFIFL